MRKGKEEQVVRMEEDQEKVKSREMEKKMLQGCDTIKSLLEASELSIRMEIRSENYAFLGGGRLRLVVTSFTLSFNTPDMKHLVDYQLLSEVWNFLPPFIV